MVTFCIQPQTSLIALRVENPQYKFICSIQRQDSFYPILPVFMDLRPVKRTKSRSELIDWYKSVPPKNYSDRPEVSNARYHFLEFF